MYHIAVGPAANAFTLIRAMKARPIRVLIVDDHGIVRDGIRLILERQPGILVVGLAATGEQAVQAAKRLAPDLIFMDLVLPVLSGADATQRVLKFNPAIAVIIVSVSASSEHVNRAVRAGARGYVMKSAPASDLVDAVSAVMAGGRYFSAQAAGLLSESGPTAGDERGDLEKLSAREREVLHRTVAGLTSIQIGLQMSLSPKTIDTYRSRLMKKLGLADRSALIRFAIDHALAPC